MWKRELVALLSLSSWCLVIYLWLFVAVPWVCLQFVIVVFPDHTHLLFLILQLVYVADQAGLKLSLHNPNTDFIVTCSITEAVANI